MCNAQGPLLAVSRRSGDDFHPWQPNGSLRPNPDIRGSVNLEAEALKSSRSE